VVPQYLRNTSKNTASTRSSAAAWFPRKRKTFTPLLAAYLGHVLSHGGLPDPHAEL